MIKIPGYTNYYITLDGEIFSLYLGKVLKPDIGNNGYGRVTLYKSGKACRMSNHRIVADACVPNPNRYPQVNHKDGVKMNNKPENLEWCTGRQNKAHAYRIGLQKPTRGEKSGMAVLNDKKVVAIRKKYGDGGVSMKELAERYSVTTMTVFFIVHRKTWAHV